jgi:hypothetical protein
MVGIDWALNNVRCQQGGQRTLVQFHGRTLASLSIIQGAPRLCRHISVALIAPRRKQMKPPRNDGPVLDELVKRARRFGDSKSIFALLLLLEREIGSETKVALPFSTNERMKGETAHHEGTSKAHPSAAAILGQETITPRKDNSRRSACQEARRSLAGIDARAWHRA